MEQIFRQIQRKYVESIFGSLEKKVYISHYHMKLKVDNTVFFLTILFSSSQWIEKFDFRKKKAIA